MGTPYGSGLPDYSNIPPSYDQNDEDHIAPTPHNLPAGQQMRLLGSMDDEPMYPYVLSPAVTRRLCCIVLTAA